MKEIVKTESFNRIIYVAYDGKEYWNKQDCIDHEKALVLREEWKKIPHKTLTLHGYFDSFENWYYLSSEKDLETLHKFYSQDGRLYNYFKGFEFPTWVCVRYLAEGDRGSEYDLITLDILKQAVNEIEDGLK